MARRLIGALIAVTLVLSPWESGLLPEPLHRLGAAPAQAQQPGPAVVDGNAQPCEISQDDQRPGPGPGQYRPKWTLYDKGMYGGLTPDELNKQSPLCWVKTHPPCPWNPVGDGFMELLEDGRDLCNAGATNNNAPDWVTACLRVNADGYRVDDDAKPVNNDGSPAQDGNPTERFVKNPSDTGISGFVNHYEVIDGEPTCTLLFPPDCRTESPRDQSRWQGPGLYRVSRDACRGYMRRTWDCPTTHPVALNQFNRCGGRSTVNTSSGHPACDQNSPVAVIDCEDYVGADFVANPAATACEEFDQRHHMAHPTAEPPLDTFFAAANAHWCTYGVMHVHLKCERSNPSDPDCDPQRTAVCIMRSSDIGGCDGVAHRMICSDLQAAYETARGQSPLDQLAVERTLRRLRENDCRPCVFLPFSDAPVCNPHGLAPTPVPSAIGKATAGDVRVEAVDFQLFAWDLDPKNRGAEANRRYYFVDDSAIFARFARMSYTDHSLCNHWRKQMEKDMKNGRRPDYSKYPSNDPTDPTFRYHTLHDECKQLLCSSPTVGRVDWRSEHMSGLAVIGTPLIMTIDDIPLRTQTIRFVDRNIPGGNKIDNHGSGEFSTLKPEKRKFLVRYDPVTGSEPLLFTREVSDISEPSHSINDAYSNRVECSLRDPTNGQRAGDKRRNVENVSWYDDGDIPEFGLLITELWPDIDAAEIERLFGGDSLAWWANMLEPDRRRASEARGYVYIDMDASSEAEVTAERSRRNWVRIEEIPCEGTVPRSQASSALRCRWTPRRSGFYSVQAAGVWRLRIHEFEQFVKNPNGGERLRLLEPDERASLDRLLAYDGSDKDTDGLDLDDMCSPSSELERSRDRDCLIKNLEWMLDYKPPDIAPGMTDEQKKFIRDQIQLIRETVLAPAAGLRSDFKGLLDATESTPPDPWGRNCLTLRDFRYTCHPYDPVGKTSATAATEPSGRAAGYTTSEPVGVMVHGAQVVTRRPVGSP
ncbi:hypothetical protein [Candidatus Poriferisodalis sp.]|uniref:hypothetical protein n=1 Tax=Candidatus Poriferisodalis sp. TaxID=3101277 RepID=UPI003B01EF34